MTYVFLLVLVTLGLLILPLVPAIIELLIPTDNQALRVVQDYDNNPMHFADGFQKYINQHFADDSAIANLQRSKVLPDGTHFRIIDEDQPIQLDEARKNHHLLFSKHPLTLKNQAFYQSEAFSKSHLMAGSDNHYRALLGTESLSIGENSTVWRWAHSEGNVTVDSNAILNGRVTSRKIMTLGIGVRFERLHAEKIICSHESAKPVTSKPIKHITLTALQDVKSQAGRRSLLEGSLKFPAGHFFDGDIVAGSSAIIGDNAHIKGSIKSNALNDLLYYLHDTGAITEETVGSARFEIGNNVRIDGTVISTHDLFIGQNCQIFGPVIAENILVIRTGTVIGSPTHPTTVTAPQIIIEEGCVIYGSLWAKDSGIVRSAVSLQEVIAV